jgi:hypothetical protein
MHPGLRPLTAQQADHDSKSPNHMLHTTTTDRMDSCTHLQQWPSASKHMSQHHTKLRSALAVLIAG